MVRLDSSVGIPAVRRNAREAICCRGVSEYPPGKFLDFWPSEVVSDGKKVATGVYIDLQLWTQCLL